MCSFIIMAQLVYTQILEFSLHMGVDLVSSSHIPAFIVILLTTLKLRLIRSLQNRSALQLIFFGPSMIQCSLF